MDDLDKTMDVIQTEIKKDDKKKIIGIAGCSGCGKSYFLVNTIKNKVYTSRNTCYSPNCFYSPS